MIATVISIGVIVFLVLLVPLSCLFAEGRELDEQERRESSVWYGEACLYAEQCLKDCKLDKADERYESCKLKLIDDFIEGQCIYVCDVLNEINKLRSIEYEKRYEKRVKEEAEKYFRQGHGH